MRLRPRQGLLLGIAVLAAGSVVLELALGRTSAALLGPHLALAAPTLALAGFGLGGALLGALPGLVRRPALLARMSTLSGMAGAGALAAVLVLVHVKVPDTLDRGAVGPLAAIAVAAALPFVFAGIAAAAAVRHVPILAGRVVFSVFTGAALGAPLALGAVRAGAPRAVLMALGAYAFASLLFYLGARSADPVVQRPRGALVATFLLAAGVLLAGDLGAPWLKMPGLRFSPLDKVDVQEWSGLGLLTIDKPQAGVSWVRRDGTGAVPLYEGKTQIPLGPDEMAYVLHRDQGPVAILGGAAGREVRAALKYGQKEIDAVDLDPIMVRSMMLDRYKKASGEVYDSPALKISIEEGRSFVRRSGKSYRNIVIPLMETQAASTAGALAAEPTDLLTVEALADLLSRLVPEGTISVTRADGDLDRLLAVAGAALARAGAADATQHLYACSAARATTLVIRKTPLPPLELGHVRNFCRRNKMTEAFAPDISPGDAHHAAARDPEAAAAAMPSVDLRPPTDDRPFFASTVPAQLLGKTLGDRAAATGAQGLLVLAGMVGIAAVVVFFAVGLPLAAWPRWPVGRARPLLFFASVGAALAFAASALVPRLVTLAGHPIYAYTTVLPALLASIGVGGLVMGRVSARGAEASAGLRAELLVAVLAGVTVAVGPVVQEALALPFGARLAAGLVLLAPVGLLAGSLLALGVRLVGWVSPPLAPWCWGMAAVGAVLAAAVALPAAMLVGYSTVLLAAGVSALLAAGCVPRSSRPQGSPP